MRTISPIALACAVLASLAVAEEPPAAQPTPAAAPRADLGPANDLVRNGAYAEAEKVLRELQQSHPDDPRILLMRGELLLALEQPAEAIPLLRRCIEIDPVRPRAHFQLGTALQATGDPDAALAAYAEELALAEDPRVKVMAHLNRSVILQQKGDRTTAADELSAVLELDPGRREVYGDLANLLLEAGRLDEAAAILDRGLGAGFRSAAHFNTLGSRYYSAGSPDKALTAFRRALEIDPTPDPEAARIAEHIRKAGSR
jgi:tetratricopeptide (TPR) repeat protein